AEAIMLLISNKTPLVSHIFNPILTKGKDIIKVLETNGKKIRIVDDEQYPKELRSIASTNSALSISGVVEDIMHPVSNGARIKVLADKTVSLLEALGFTWKTINKNYLKKALSQILD
ncbi:MAG: hypothetical protein FWG21_04490, partial [Oscillospiraceae bacterium]|nr:hypothetical protein [Oscillospiraceae bacterium]